MNELMILFDGSQWIYFKTPAAAVDKAYQCFEETCSSADINIDNMLVRSAILRDSHGSVIDTLSFL